MEQENNPLQETIAEIVKKFSNRTDNEIVEILANIMFSIGASLEGCTEEPLSSEEVLTRYAGKPTLGNVLMIQAKSILELWTRKEQ